MDIIKLKKLVLQEIDNLKIHATQDEIAKLDFTTFKPFKADRCIYGQMTGSCFSDRATSLLNLCAVPYSYYTSSYERYLREPDFRRKPGDWQRGFSALEFYVDSIYDGNEQIIAYLKGEIQTLNL